MTNQTFRVIKKVMQRELEIMDSLKKDPNGEEMPAPETEPFHWTDVFYHKRAFEFMGVEDPNTSLLSLEALQYYLWVAIFYVVVFIPSFIVVRTFLFLILPKSWLRWMFKI